MDVLSDVLRTIRLDGALFLYAEFREPWCVNSPSGAELATLLPTGAEHLAVCHFVMEGGCRVQSAQGPPLSLQAGDVAVFPHGDPHRIGSSVERTPVTLEHIVEPKLPDLTRIRYGGDGQRTRVACGWFAYERNRVHPLIECLPTVFRTAIGERACGAWLAQSVQCALDDAAAGHAGAQVLVARVAEALFVEAMRGYFETLPEGQAGWFAGLRDPQVSRCLALLHAQPAREWSVAELARETGVSRSVLAERFRLLVGMAPMQYLVRWRMALAARLLREPHSTLVRVCEAVGYTSESAFHRAFKREHGVAPGQWRRQARGDDVSRAGVAGRH